MLLYIIPALIVLSAIGFFSYIEKKKKMITTPLDNDAKPVIFVTLRNYLLMRFYLRNSPTLFSVFLSGKDGQPILSVMNRMVNAKGMFDYIHSLTPQFTIWELQKNASPDTYMIMENKAMLGIVKELSMAQDGGNTFHGMGNFTVREGKLRQDDSFMIYLIEEGAKEPSVPCFDDLHLIRSFNANASQLMELLSQQEHTLVICRKWHLKELADHLKQAVAPSSLN